MLRIIIGLIIWGALCLYVGGEHMSWQGEEILIAAAAPFALATIYFVLVWFASFF